MKKGKGKGDIQDTGKGNKKDSPLQEGRKLLKALSRKGRSSEEISQLTPAMLKDGSWKEKTFRKYNISQGRREGMQAETSQGVLDFTKYKLVSMGFEEMRGPLVEAEFWSNNYPLYAPVSSCKGIYTSDIFKRAASCKKINEPYLKS